ncbi:MAG: flavin reductase family protein [bacterium]|nr:flavin reductase family protein [bacterium]
MSIDPEVFRQTLASFASGVTVVTSQLDGERHGMTVSAFASVSLDPPLVLICADKGSRTHAMIRDSKVFQVSVLAANQDGVSNLFASKSKEASRFEGLDCPPGATGCPRIPDALAYLDCRVERAVEAGDHIVYIGLVEAAEISESDPLVYFRGAYRGLV